MPISPDFISVKNFLLKPALILILLSYGLLVIVNVFAAGSGRLLLCILKLEYSNVNVVCEVASVVEQNILSISNGIDILFIPP